MIAMHNGQRYRVRQKSQAPSANLQEGSKSQTSNTSLQARFGEGDNELTCGATVDDASDASGAEPKEGRLKVKEVALIKDATEVEYKEAVEDVVFKSKSDVKSVCAELSANLKAQGWTNEGADLIQPQSSILKRKRGAAKLTIFVKPADGGSQVQVFTEGLVW
jgi:hypothetical protein